jgi:hypothetical protein
MMAIVTVVTMNMMSYNNNDSYDDNDSYEDDGL